MTLHSALAAGATLISLAFAAATAERWWDRRRPHELAWTVALGCFAIAGVATWWGASFGWDMGSFRAFYAFGAVVNVPVLALGTWYLLAPSRVAHAAAVITTISVSFAAGIVFAAPTVAPIGNAALPQGSEVFGAGPRICAAVASSIGAIVLLGGATWTLVRLRRQTGQAARRLAGANGFIALGTIALSAGGLFNSVLGQMTAFLATLVAGIALLFVGFLITVPRSGSTNGATPSP